MYRSLFIPTSTLTAQIDRRIINGRYQTTHTIKSLTLLTFKFCNHSNENKHSWGRREEGRGSNNRWIRGVLWSDNNDQIKPSPERPVAVRGPSKEQAPAWQRSPVSCAVDGTLRSSSDGSDEPFPSAYSNITGIRWRAPGIDPPWLASVRCCPVPIWGKSSSRAWPNKINK